MLLNGLGVAAFFSKELNAMVEKKMDLVRARNNRFTKVAALSHVDARIEQIENSLARSMLLLEALSEVCISKGLLTRDEISQMADKIDLDRATSFVADETSETMASTPEEFFHQLEERDRREVQPVESETCPGV